VDRNGKDCPERMAALESLDIGNRASGTGQKGPAAFKCQLPAATCRETHDRRRRAPQILDNCGVGRWRTCSRFALLCEIPCRIEKVRDNLGGGVFRQGSRGCYFGVRSKRRGVATVQAGSMPSKSRKPHEWPIYPKPDIPGRLPERLLRPTFSHSTAARLTLVRT